MTSADLCRSIIEFHITRRLADYKKKGVFAPLIPQAEIDFGSLAGFKSLLDKDYSGGHTYNIRISEKQARFLQSLFSKERGSKAILEEGLEAWATNPKVFTSGYGGTRGTRPDTSRWILKIKPLIDANK
jgi:hypothetical protein